jgi:hypothetical protein
MRIVLDAREVAGAKVTRGAVNVYYSTTGPKDPVDILVGSINAGVATLETIPGMATLWGEFYVVGE